ncbi:MAG TPA: response regulator transcription factor [Candidatus Obscuribacterales bacterium]
MVRVFIAEDQEIVRLGLKMALPRTGQVEVVGEADNGTSAMEKIAACRPSVVLLDLDLPGQDGIETTRAIKQQLPETRVVIFTGHTDDRRLFDALEAGADAYVVKTSDIDKLLTAIQTVMQGAIWLDPAVGTKVVRASTNRHAAPQQPKSQPKEQLDFLSEREKEIVKMIANGLGNQAIAHQLYLSIDTVKTHIRNIMEKMEANNRTEAAVKAIKLGMVV